jgi:DNA polymerase III delta subunit
MTLTRHQSPAALRAELARAVPANLFLFMGEEEGEKDKIIAEILDTVFRDIPDRSNCVARFHIENNEFPEAADFLLSPSIFYPVRACVLYNINALKKDDHCSHLLTEIFQTISPSMTLIMTTELNNPPPLLTRDMLEKTRIVQFWRYFDRDIERYVNMTTAKLGLFLDRSALVLLLELTGRDIKKIDEALFMLQNASDSGKIDENIVASVVHDRRETNIFEFIDSLFTRGKNALLLLEKILEKGTPELLIANMILRQAEILELYHSLAAGGTAPEEALNRCGVLPKKRETFWKMADAFPRERAEKIFPLVARADYEMKSGGKSRIITRNPVFILASEILYSI